MSFDKVDGDKQMTPSLRTMKPFHFIFLAAIVVWVSCATHSKSKEQNPEWVESIPPEKAAQSFARSILNARYHETEHRRMTMGYWDVQMLFEADDWKSDRFSSFTTYSATQTVDQSGDGYYNDVLLFATPYKDEPSAQHAFAKLKEYAQIRYSDIEGQAGLLAEQVQILERIRESGGLFLQQGNYLFFLPESCDAPPVGKTWREYEQYFLRDIAPEKKKVEVLNANCGEDVFEVEEVLVWG